MLFRSGRYPSQRRAVIRVSEGVIRVSEGPLTESDRAVIRVSEGVVPYRTECRDWGQTGAKKGGAMRTKRGGGKSRMREEDEKEER